MPIDIHARWGAPAEIEPVSIPPYPHIHSGTCLVVGTAWTMWEDLERARLLRPEHTIFGINRTGEFIRCDLMFSIDRSKIAGWRALQERNFGKGHFIYHSWKPTAGTTHADYPEIDYWWPHSTNGGTSSWSAVKVAKFMGFDEIILCGVPLSPGDYADGKKAETFQSEAHVRNSREAIKMQTWAHENVFSMSGWTRELFGEPC